MPIIKQIERKLERFILRIDNKKLYSKIVELKNGVTESQILMAVEKEGLLSDGYLSTIGVTCEVNFNNLKRVALSPHLFLLIDSANNINSLKVDDFKLFFQRELMPIFKEYKNLYSTYFRYTLDLLHYRNLIPQEVFDTIIKDIQHKFELGIKELRDNDELGYYHADLQLFYKKKLYECCNLLEIGNSGNCYFNSLILEMYTVLISKNDRFKVSSFESAIQFYDIQDDKLIKYFAKSREKANEDKKKYEEEMNVKFRRNRQVVSTPNSTKSESNYLIIVPLIFLGLFFAINIFLNETDKVYSSGIQLPEQPELTYSILFGFKINDIYSNQYENHEFTTFEPCEFKIENTGFENPKSISTQFKKVKIANQTSKDIIVIYGSRRGLTYRFLSSYDQLIEIRPVRGWLKFYAGKGPESTINTSRILSDVAFRFKVFTKEDSTLLQKDFNLDEIKSVNDSYCLMETGNIVNLLGK